MVLMNKFDPSFLPAANGVSVMSRSFSSLPTCADYRSLFRSLSMLSPKIHNYKLQKTMRCTVFFSQERLKFGSKCME